MMLVDRHAGTFGLNRTLVALGVSKGTWHHRQRCPAYIQKYAALRDPLMEIARQHPCYGYRKVVDELRSRGWETNHKVVRKLHKAWDLTILRSVKHPKQSAIRQALRSMGNRINLVSGLPCIDIFDVLYTDFTELRFDRGRAKAQLMPIVDHAGKLVVGWALGDSANSELALEAYARAKRRLLQFGMDLTSVIIHHDQDPVYTGNAWIRALRIEDGVRISYSLDGAKQNTFMESFNAHFKEENSSIFWEQKSIVSLRNVVQSRIEYYNDIRRHASLGNLAPMQYLKKNGFEPRQVVSSL